MSQQPNLQHKTKPEIQLSHSIIRNLYKLLMEQAVPWIEKSPMGKAIWIGLKGQVPMMFESLDKNTEAISFIKQEIKRMAYEDMCETNLQASSNLKENDNDNAKAAD